MPRVFSAHAEVVPMVYDLDGMGMRILRAHGGSSHATHEGADRPTYSPRTRR